MADGEFIIGVDTGGTFTDCVLIEVGSGSVRTAKALSTPDDFSVGLFESLGRAAGQAGMGLDELISRTAQIVIGTTVGTNAFLERRGAVTGLITTRGFRDTLFIMRGIGRVTGRSPEEALVLETTAKPAPLVPKSLIREIDERVDWEGEVLVEPSREAVLEAAAELVAAGVEAISICLLWAFKEPANEIRVRDWVAEAHPGLYVSCSHEIAPKIGEMERFAATTINAYVGPKTTRYLERVTEALREKGYDQSLLVMGCDGGVRTAGLAAREAIKTLNSGPAGGVTGSAAIAASMSLPDVITADVGGTSFDVALVRGGEVEAGARTVLGNYEFFIPAIDVQSIGAGGGSIAWVDERRRTLRVGPESAGSDPGPVCFDRGGERPTLTDAALCLGYLSEQSFLGKGDKLDVERARAALGQLGAPLGLSWEDAAAGIVRVAESQMSDLVRRMVVSKGHDPRDFSVLAYGGAGPVHATGFSRDLSVRSIVVPAGNSASVWSAYGVATSDIKHVYEYAAILGEPFDPDAIGAVYRDLAAVAREQLAAEGVPLDDTRFQYEAGLHYKGQLSEIYVPLEDGESLDEGALSDAVEEFERRYADVFGEGSAFRQAGVEMVDFRLTTVTATQRPPLRLVAGDGAVAPTGERRIRFVGLGEGGGERVAAQVFDGEALGAGAVIAGPAAIELPGTTVVVAPDFRATRHESGSFVLEARASEEVPA